jgi:hypothetical protein
MWGFTAWLTLSQIPEIWEDIEKEKHQMQAATLPRDTPS